jgi:hypothetical protein
MMWLFEEVLVWKELILWEFSSNNTWWCVCMVRISQFKLQFGCGFRRCESCLGDSWCELWWCHQLQFSTRNENSSQLEFLCSMTGFCLGSLLNFSDEFWRMTCEGLIQRELFISILTHCGIIFSWAATATTKDKALQRNATSTSDHLSSSSQTWHLDAWIWIWLDEPVHPQFTCLSQSQHLI